MIVISESAARQLVTPADAIDAVESAFKHVAQRDATNFPVVRERLLPGLDVYGIKSGAAISAGMLGLKIGGYWRGNAALNLTRHQSTTVLSDPQTGQCVALVSSNYLTGLRTAAACALAIRTLARRDVRTLGVIGSGAQALFHIELACLVRPFERVLIASANPQNASACAEKARRFKLDARAADAETVTREADVLITLTPSTRPVVMREWVRPGTHISAMGADTAGKQELDARIMTDARVYVDDWAQAASIGECQAAVRAQLLSSEGIAGSLCDVLAGALPGRSDDSEITVFDSSGMAVQDIFVANRALQAASAGAVDGVYAMDLTR
jgi:ornithine cyclodeaminase